jgi:hypothetical protein
MCLGEDDTVEDERRVLATITLLQLLSQLDGD